MTAFTVWKFETPEGAESACSRLEGAADEGLIKILDHAVVGGGGGGGRRARAPPPPPAPRGGGGGVGVGGGGRVRGGVFWLLGGR
jgi:hypothetical protein